MAKLKILFDYSPACRDNKTGIPLFVKNLYQELEAIENIEITKSRCRSLVHCRLYRFLYNRVYLPLKLQFGGYDIYIENQFMFLPLFKPKQTKVVNIIYDIGLVLFDDIQTPEYTKKWRERLPISINNSDILVTISQSSLRDIKPYLLSINQSHKPLEYIYANVDLLPQSPLLIDTLKTKYAIKDKYFLFLGTLEPRKNPLQLVKAFKEFKVQTADPIKLVFAGKKGWLYDDVMEYIKSNALENEVIFIGYISDEEKITLLQNTQAFIFLSIYEGFGMPPLEALKLGTPTLLSDIAVFRELFEESAYYVDPYDVRAISDGMKKILEKPPIIDDIIFNKFSWEKSAKKLVEIIKDTIE